MVIRTLARASIGALHSGAACIMVVACASSVHAGVVSLGGGWEAQWDASLDGLVNISPVSVTSSTITITKSANFEQGPVNGIFPSIPIVFQQVGASTITSIVIDSESVTNNTGSVWNGFHIDLVGSLATYNPTATNNSGPSGFVVSPFTSTVFAADNLRVDFSGGIVANGAAWTPGSGANGGALHINVSSSGIGNFFTLKETPVPGPTALSVLAVGILMYTPRRRRDA